MNQSTNISIITIALLLVVRAANAQSPLPEPTPPAPLPASDLPKAAPAKLDSVEVRASRDASSSDGITRVVGAAELTKYGDGNVLDVLKRQPGVTVTNGQVSLRGIGSAYVRVLVDGQRPPPGFSIDTLAPSMVERIEIMPSSGVEFSSQSIGGTINIILKRTRTGQQASLGVVAEGNADNQVLRTTGTWGDSSGPWAWSLNSNARVAKTQIETQSEIESSLQSVTQIQRTGFSQNDGVNKSINLGPRLTYTPSTSTRVQLQMGAWIWRNDADTQSQSLNTVGLASRFDNSVGLSSGEGHGHWLNSELTQSLGNSSKLELKGRSGRWYSKNQNAISYTDPVVPLLRQIGNADRGSWQFVGATLRHSLSAEQNLSVGVEVSKDVFRGTRNDLLNGISQNFATDVTSINQSEQHAAFVRHEFTINSSWATDLGLRWERIQFDVDAGNPTERTSKQALLSPAIQVQYKPGRSKTEQFRLEIGRKWKALRAFELSLRKTLSLDNRFETPDQIGNESLRPETSSNIDFAYTRRIGTEGSVGVTALHKRLDDIVLSRTTIGADGRWFRRTENVGSGTMLGLELEYKGVLSDFISKGPKTQVRASVGRYWSKLAALPAPGNRVASQSPLNFNTGFDHRVAGLPLTWGASFKYSARGLQRNSEFDTTRLSNERALGMYASWIVNPKMTMRIAAENLLSNDTKTTNEYARNGFDQSQISVIDVKPLFRMNFDIKL